MVEVVACLHNGIVLHIHLAGNKSSDLNVAITKVTRINLRALVGGCGGALGVGFVWFCMRRANNFIFTKRCT